MNIHQHGRRILCPLALALAVSIAPLASVASAPTASPSFCEARWGSLVKVRGGHTSQQVTNVRSGRHRCFDRLAVDINAHGDGRPGFHVQYVRRVTRDGSGTVIPLRGSAKLRIIVNAPAYDSDYGSTYQYDDRRELADVAGYRTFRQVAWGNTFEGQSTIGLGVRARLPMRAFVVDKPGGGHTVVVDVAHDWN